ncbi:hypothetical protein CP967_08475 [Streptomyces nitrosporeus]|uniref:Uncharacterized protein n=1 Tax=Streptomyces nitrosporeus TaxID=28894 RepID=A0A5J6F6L9_9ACTN|nr:hypothetical protein [Streptomyces nitrosporeus]QEU71998.1 hypothetical protein CP967_08475 [Streptomyces nitrosporeus]GGY81387.1 hypothetical protein GCM10010327_10070 [Streptomyces nitrosporeus]
MGSRIRTAQKQARELGRLRTGYSIPSDDPKKRARPVRSTTWVLSSHAEHYVVAAAEAWGGEVERWQPQGNGAPQFRVITKAEQLDAILPPGDPLSQANEMWNKGGCARRCDGEIEQISRHPCLCLAEHGPEWHLLRQDLSTKDKVCAPTSRLSVVLPDMPDVGVWRVETHSFYAANELAGTVDMVLSGTGGKGLVPVTLRIEPRTRVAGGKTKHFPVVVVEIRGVTTRQALTGPLPTAVALDPTGARGAAAIEAPRPDYLAQAEGALTVDDVQDVYRTANTAGHLNDALVAALKKRAEELKAEAAATRVPDPEPDEDGAYPAEVIDDTEQTSAWPAVAQAGSGGTA